jgi:hypothetical protein
VVDKKRGLKATLNGTTEFCFSINQGEKGRELLIIAGDSAFVAKSTAGILDVPLTFSLSQNMPNPFNPVTTIKYTVAEKKKGAQHVSMKVYDARGRFVKMLVNEKLESGYYSVTWNGKNAKGESLGSGLYFYSIAVGRDFRKVRKMVVLK